MSRRALVTGGAGFIGSALVFELLEAGWAVTVLDALTYAAAPGTVAAVEAAAGCTLITGDIRDRTMVRAAFAAARPDAVFHLAAETHVDRSIDAADDFITTNVNGTFEVLEAARAWRDSLPANDADQFCMVHVSTDEVFGELGETGHFNETTPYAPSSPYSASKAGSDHLGRAWARTYGLDVRISNCSNNYGPATIPREAHPAHDPEWGWSGAPCRSMATAAKSRDWLHVSDHAHALRLIAERGARSETYCVGGNAERSNLAVVHTLCDLLDARDPGPEPRRTLINHVADRPGHDRRYAIDASHMQSTLGWRPKRQFEESLDATVTWYLDNADWWRPLTDRYGRDRIGLTTSKPG
jgi:dTDP-glucose 4,6-dehydratase